MGRFPRAVLLASTLAAACSSSTPARRPVAPPPEHLAVVDATPPAVGPPARRLRLATTSYVPLVRELPFLAALPPSEQQTASALDADAPAIPPDEDMPPEVQEELAAGRAAARAAPRYVLGGRVGSIVGWLGILREVTTLGPRMERWRVEMKHFDGLADAHLMALSFNGAGDFMVDVAGPPGRASRRMLVRIYGRVLDEAEGVPRVRADYVRTWALGQYAFLSEYGWQAEPSRWRALRQPGGRIYDPFPDEAYYDRMLGP